MATIKARRSSRSGRMVGLPPVERAALALRSLCLDPPEREHRFHPTRQWRIDLAYPEIKLGFEVEGANFAFKDTRTGELTVGRHLRGKGYANDIEKYNEATLLGWMIIRTTGDQIDSGQFATWALHALARRAPLDVTA